MKRVTFVLLAVAVLSAGVAVPAASQPASIEVMTRNQYLGASLNPVLTATTPAAFVAAVQTVLAQMAASNFPERAEALADEIVSARPHLVGLQEVFRLSLNGTTSAPPFRDQLDDLLAALSSRGVNYYVAAQVRNLNVTIPVPGLGNLQAVDRDVILARDDVPTWPVSVPGCRASLDGCNYRAFVPLPSPIGTINIERGFVAVDAQTPHGMIRFVNTHLEIPELPVVVQAAQASELVATLSALPNDQHLPVLIVGDINSTPNDQAVDVNGQQVVPPYGQFARAGYVDTWVVQPGSAPGLTCCQADDLLNPESVLFKRVDVILSSEHPSRVRAHRVGVDPESRTPSGLWPSDHAGVVARLWW